MAADVLPSSLARVDRDVQRSPYGNTTPVFCANCGAEWGRVVPELCSFAFVLCDDCARTHGDPAGLMKEPDHVFWARHNEAVAEQNPEGVALVAQEWLTAIEKGTLR